MFFLPFWTLITWLVLGGFELAPTIITHVDWMMCFLCLVHPSDIQGSPGITSQKGNLGLVKGAVQIIMFSHTNSTLLPHLGSATGADSDD
jgi:hypothetical protein